MNQLSAKAHQKLRNQLLALVENKPEPYKKALEEELTWIRLAKFEDKIQKDIELKVTGRSNPNGLVFAYLLGFTDEDPIELGYEHQYTVNPDCPDIDCDIDSEHQKQMEAHLAEVYGEDKVAHVATFAEWKPKSILKDFCRILKIGFKESNILSDMLSDEGKEDLGEVWPEMKASAPKNEEMQAAIVTLDPLMTSWASKMQGMIRQTGQHSAGIVITPDKVSDMIPTINKGGKILTGLPEGGSCRTLTDVGILKGDFLGLATCSIIGEVLKTIEDPDFDIDKIPLDDKAILNRFGRGDTECIFQLSSPGMRKLLRDIEVDSFGDICAALAIFRPGPLNAKLDEAYVRGKQDPSSIKYLHEDVIPVLAPTYGQMIYQESQMKALMVLAGFTGAEADSARKMFKKLSNMTKEQIKNSAEFSSMLDKIEKGCIDKGIAKDDVEEFVEQMKAFSGYSFCLAGHTLLEKQNGELVRIDEVERGTLIKAYDPERESFFLDRVVGMHDMGEQEVFKVELDNGLEITCTIDHKFLCSDKKMHPLYEILDKGLEIVCE